MASPRDPGHQRSSFTRKIGGDRRAVGDAPSIGRVSKFHSGFDPHSPGSRGTRQASQVTEFTGRVLRRWIAAGVIVAVLLVGAFIGAIMLRDKLWKPKVNKEALPVLAIEKQGEDEIAPTVLPQAPTPEVLEKHTTAVLEATTAAQLAPLLRPTSQSPEAILAKLKNLATVDGKVTRVAYMGPISSLATPMESVLIAFDTGHNRIGLFTPDEKGSWQLDFDAFDRTSEPSWDTLLGEAKVEGTVRVYISRDSYYNGQFASEKDWNCYALASPDRDTLMFGYTPRNGPCDKALTAALAANRKVNPQDTTPLLRVTLGVRRTEGENRRQFEIVKVYSDDWATGPKPLDEQFR